MSHLLFLDLETTGLDPDRDQILEIALIVVDADTLEDCFRFHRVVAYELQDTNLVSSVVLKMHDSTGLWRDCASLDATPLPEAMSDLAMVLRQYGRSDMLVGRNVGTFDRVFLERNCPGITKSLSHRNFDITTLLYATHRLAGEPIEFEKNPMPHRAMNDCETDLEIVREYASNGY